MKAWRVYDFNDMRLDDIQRPEAKPGWVILKVRVVQLSVTEAAVAGGETTGRSYERTKRILAQEAPVQLFGHEFCGEVFELGEDVEGLQVGDRVVAMPEIPCGSCPYCLLGEEERCVSTTIIGWTMPGALAEYVAVPASVVITVSDAVDDSEAACIQPLANCIPAVENGQIKLGDTVVVLGQGAMGIGCTQLARLSGAGKIIGVDIRPEAVEISSKLGADYAISARETDPIKVIRELTNGLGADVVFETAGGSPRAGLSGVKTVSQALEMVGKSGRVVQVGLLGDSLELVPSVLAGKSIRYIFPDLYTRETFQLAEHLVATKRVSLKPMITHKLKGLEKLPEALEITMNKARSKAISPAQIVVEE
jgi:threonine dehydrogenase-like Zn-dependent dehydrogenase